MATFAEIQRDEVSNYKRFDSDASLSEEEIPAPAQNRKKTDKYFLAVFIVFILFLISCLIYTLIHADINRLTKLYDNCGNVCGEKNVKYAEWECTGKDMTDKPIYHEGTCVPEGSSYLEDNFPRSLSDGFKDFERRNEDPKRTKIEFPYFQNVGWGLILSGTVSLGLSIALIYLFRYATTVAVWIILIFSWLCLLACVIYIWSLAILTPNTPAIVASCFLSVILLGLLCVMIFMHKQIGLLIMLLQESTKAVFDLPQIFFIPLMTIFGLQIIAALWCVSTVYMTSAGKLIGTSHNLDYVPDVLMVFTIFFNSVMAYWAVQFLVGIQHMIISGAVSKWYFTKNKDLLGNPVLTSAIITFKFHLGTVALGSLIVTLVTLLRALLQCLARYTKLRTLIVCCVGYMEGFLRFFTKNSFIITAMHGTPFYKSGKQAVMLFVLNICNTVVVNSLGDFVLIISKVLVVIVSAFTSYLLLLGAEQEYLWYSIAVVVIVSYFFANTILSTLQIVVDTMFLCFCEDCIINDGVTKPYAMPRGLMEFVEGSKKLFAKKIEEKGLPTI